MIQRIIFTISRRVVNKMTVNISRKFSTTQCSDCSVIHKQKEQKEQREREERKQKDQIARDRHYQSIYYRPNDFIDRNLYFYFN